MYVTHVFGIFAFSVFVIFPILKLFLKIVLGKRVSWVKVFANLIFSDTVLLSHVC